MRRVLALLASVTALGFAQDPRYESAYYASLTLENGIHLMCRTLSETGTGIEEMRFGHISADGNVVHRLLVQPDGVVYFAYDLHVDALPDGRAKLMVTANGRYPFFAKAPDPQIVEGADRVSLDVMRNPSSGRKITDSYRASKNWNDFAGISTVEVWPLKSSMMETLMKRDVADPNAELRFMSLRILKGGRPLDEVRDHERRCGIIGQVISASLPVKGRFLVTFSPDPKYEFRKIGVVKGSRLNFNWGADQYEWQSSSQIAPAEGEYYVWVAFDPAYDPNQSGDYVTCEAYDKAPRLAAPSRQVK
jgi:hypothetical protein